MRCATAEFPDRVGCRAGRRDPRESAELQLRHHRDVRAVRRIGRRPTRPSA